MEDVRFFYQQANRCYQLAWQSFDLRVAQRLNVLGNEHTAKETEGRLAVLFYRAPAGFGPPRHLHRQDDEIFLIEQGAIALWTPHECRTAGPGDVVMLPKVMPHTWRAYGDDPIRFQVTVTPGEFEIFFERIAERNLTLADRAELAEVASAAGMDIVGPPLSDEEVAAIVGGERV
jgi:mannose-6-phosphate isomerase-like protein (cupin superfamily)